MWLCLIAAISITKQRFKVWVKYTSLVRFSLEKTSSNLTEKRLLAPIETSFIGRQSNFHLMKKLESFFVYSKKSRTKHYFTWHTLTKPPRFTTTARAEIKTQSYFEYIFYDHQFLWLQTNFPFPVCITIIMLIKYMHIY